MEQVGCGRIITDVIPVVFAVEARRVAKTRHITVSDDGPN